jgi:hypothetical protein
VNPWDLTATELLVWALVAHCVADWLLQSDWMAANKANLRHPAGYVHAGIHGGCLALVFGWLALPLAVAHLLIDTRKPVAWLAGVIRQTPPKVPVTTVVHPTLGFSEGGPFADQRATVLVRGPGAPMVDMGMLVRMNVDQVWHVVTLAAAALVAP